MHAGQRWLVLVGSVLSMMMTYAPARAKPPIYIAFHWHMHQPIYWPYESVVQTEGSGKYGFSLTAVHTDRTGPYTAWPMDAVAAGMNDLGSLGAQISFSGSLMENLNALAAAGWGFGNWQNGWRTAMGWNTTRGNPRIDLVQFGYHHPLMPLVDRMDIELQVQLHKEMLQRNIYPQGVTPRSKGMFPPENAMSERIIPALVSQGIQWVMVDNIHFDRTHVSYPYSSGSNLYPPNGADQTSNPSVNWVQLNGIWAGSKVSAPWGYQPHWIRHVDPQTGQSTRMIAVPTARYEGNEDARGGFGALQYETVMSQYEQFNTDDNHPMLIVLHHDGDNYGGGTESYYHGNFQNFINWVKSQPQRFVATTVQDYLDQFPPAADDVIHIEDGSWSGAANGDPEFLKWNGEPDASGYSPDRNSWAAIVAARNRVMTAESIQAHTSTQAILDNTGNETDKAWHHFLNSETSCYWYWDGQQQWDSHPTRAANLAVHHADMVLGANPADTVAPSVYPPQRDPYNPGGIEWGTTSQPSDFKVWTFAYDVSGLASVTLFTRVDEDGTRTDANELYASGTWSQTAMLATTMPSSTTDPQPTYQAQMFSAMVTGLNNVLVDYYVEAVDNKGNRARSAVMHVYVGAAGNPNQSLWTPERPTVADVITITSTKPGFLHWGVNNWTLPVDSYRPSGSTVWSDNKAVETPLVQEGTVYRVRIGPFMDPAQAVTTVNFVFRWTDPAGWSSPDQAIPILPLGADAGVSVDAAVAPDAAMAPDASSMQDAAVITSDAGDTRDAAVEPTDAAVEVDGAVTPQDAGLANDAAQETRDAAVEPDAAVVLRDAGETGDASVVMDASVLADASVAGDASVVAKDGGSVINAARIDGAVADSGVNPADGSAVVADGGTADSGVIVASGNDDDDDETSCACHASPVGVPDAMWLVMAALVLVSRRQRRR